MDPVTTPRTVRLMNSLTAPRPSYWELAGAIPGTVYSVPVQSKVLGAAGWTLTNRSPCTLTTTKHLAPPASPGSEGAWIPSPFQYLIECRAESSWLRVGLGPSCLRALTNSSPADQADTPKMSGGTWLGTALSSQCR